MKLALAELPALTLLWLRFGLSTLLLVPVITCSPGQIRRRTVGRGFILGVALFASFFFLIKGLATTTASNTGFLSGLSAVWVPLLARTALRKPVGLEAMVAIVMSLAGLLLLNWGGPIRLGRGDVLVVVGSIFTAIHIIGLDILAKDEDSRVLTFIQVITMAILSFGATWALEPTVLPQHTTTLLVMCVMFTASFSTVFAFWIQASFQKRTTPTRAVLIYLLEPVFAAISSALILGEELRGVQWAGGGLVVLGMLIAQIVPRSRHDTSTTPSDQR